jgi:5-methylcytosine-specific restriction endonuclease McrA
MNTKLRIASEQTWKCYLCKEMLSHNFDLDHKKALCLGGKNEYSNYAAACTECHRKKTYLENCGVRRKKFICEICGGIEFSKYFLLNHIH